ncbi:MAG: phosphopantetheinyl transferase [Comamonadaceae bacterium]|nr:phosphopantetheinyl transferase [Comamonadaceae bacterium]
MMETATAESSHSLITLRQRLAERLGKGFGVACSGVDGDPQRLYPEEFEAVRKAVPRRQREFSAGRQAARQAMMDIGWSPMAIPSAADRSPVWPEGLVGSISHTRQWCVAVVCPTHLVRGIGIDMEHDQPMGPELWDTICTPEEHAWVATQAASLQGLWVTRLFSAKEAYFKWQYPQTGQMLEFQDVQVVINTQTMSFDIHPASVKRTRMRAHRRPGQFLVSDEHLLAWVVEPGI